MEGKNECNYINTHSIKIRIKSIPIENDNKCIRIKLKIDKYSLKN